MACLLVTNMIIIQDTASQDTIGARIRELRKSRGLSQQVLADRILTDKSSVSRWENDERIPNPDMIAAIAEILGVTPNYLMFGLNNHAADNLIDVNGLTFYQIDLVKKLVEELRRGC